MATVILENVTRRPPRMLIFNLTRATAPTPITTRQTETTADGVTGVRVIKKVVAGSLTLPHRTPCEVDEKIAACPEVAEAIKRKYVKVTKTKAVVNGPKTRRKKG